ncbi:PilZ domain-containing protein [Kineococcus rhizosphaerae]|uniref:PilZ domain-containing protein n=1 Tax=Kineococcus rhizosphaerae TaxID=559628 RepID=A0A2T0QYL1_9ACTN|nr:PilZ domain-containing protein [Kineococcus rhizosphaerae]PRY11459.1 PilZ domain-containing protein [Kineococcus rhizosphaerae]
MDGTQGGTLMTEGPAIDTTVTLMPTTSSTGAWHTGTVRSWTAGAAGLVVTSHVAADPATVEELDGQRVWVSTDAGDDTSVTPHAVFQAVAQAHRDDELALTGVMLLAAETRRGAVRAPASLPAHLTMAEGVADVRTVDYSRTGMRVEGAMDMPAHADVDVALELADGREVHARGEVLRVDETSGEAVVRFVELDEGAAEALERSVLTELARQNRG